MTLGNTGVTVENRIVLDKGVNVHAAFGTKVIIVCSPVHSLVCVTGPLWRALIARRVMYIKHLFWQAPEQCLVILVD